MSNGDIMSREDRIKEALGTLEELGASSRGDSFDLGGEVTRYEGQDSISQYLSNPKQLSQLFSLTEKQAENVCSLITGGSSAFAYKLLARHLGSELSGAIGGFLGGYLSKRVIGK